MKTQQEIKEKIFFYLGYITCLKRYRVNEELIENYQNLMDELKWVLGEDYNDNKV